MFRQNYYLVQVVNQVATLFAYVCLDKIVDFVSSIDNTVLQKTWQNKPLRIVTVAI